MYRMLFLGRNFESCLLVYTKSKKSINKTL